MHRMNTWACRVLIGCSLILAGCDESAKPSPEPQGSARPTASPTTGQSANPPTASSIDPAAVEAATGIKPEVADGVVKVSYPRNEVKVEVDGWAMPPFMGLTSWAGFTPGEKPGVEAMVMGDLVLFEDEVSDVMSAAVTKGIEVTALLNHFFFDKPNAYFMHIGGEGKLDALAKGVKSALDAMKAVRAKSKDPKDRFEGAAIPAKSAIDGAKIEAAFGVK